jgi:HD-GYP domain-containing protein (c-di-GMP phosphodiesterase class II)
MRLADIVRRGGASLALPPEVETAPSRRLKASPRRGLGPVLERLTAGAKKNAGALSDRSDNSGGTSETVRRAVKAVEGIFERARPLGSFQMTEVEKAVKSLLQGLETDEALLVPLFSPGGESPTPALEAVNVCALAVKIGTELEYDASVLRRLGSAVLLASGAAEEAGSWLTVAEHASVVRLARLYGTLVFRRHPRSSAGVLEALGELMRRERAAFPDRILKALIRVISAFPVGCLVRLSTGEVGRVVAKNKDFPLRPVVEILVRRGRWLEEPIRVDLRQSPLHHIKDSVPENALPGCGSGSLA